MAQKKSRYIKKSVKQSVDKKSNNICYCCGKYSLQLEYSHIKAHSKGGSNLTRNLRKCCRDCNRSMGNTHMYKFILNNNLYGPGRKDAEQRVSMYPGIMK